MSQSQSAKTTNLTRRQAMRGLVGGAAAGIVGSAGINYSTRDAKAIAPAIPVVGFAAGAGIAYLMDKNPGNFLGDNRDLSNYQGADNLLDEIEIKVTEMKSADERVMASISNNLTNSENVALAKGKAAAVEAMNNEESESVAGDKMSAAVDEYYSIIQENIITHYEAQSKQVHSILQLVEGHADISAQNHFYKYDDLNNNDARSLQDNWSAPPLTTDTITLLNGTDVTYEYPEYNYDSLGAVTREEGHYAFFRDTSEWSSGDALDETHLIIDHSDIGPVYNSIETKATDVIDQLAGFITDVYAQYEPGEIPTEDIVDPITASTELRQDYDGYQTQGAHAAMLGIPTTAEQAVHLTIKGTDENGDPVENDVTADIYTEYVPTDADGNEVGFRSGVTYDPTGWDKPLYIAYEYVDADGNVTSDFVQLENEFTINSITDKDGNEVDSFQTESRNNQTADVSKLQEELDQLREEQQRLQEESQDDVVGGGGGFLSDIGTDSNSTIIAVVAVILVAFGLLNN